MQISTAFDNTSYHCLKETVLHKLLGVITDAFSERCQLIAAELRFERA